MTPQPARRPPRYRVVVHELNGPRHSQVMDATGAGYIACVATIEDGEMDAQLADGGPRHLQQHIALLIAREHHN